MLAQDYILKQLTASLMYPEKELGKKFWDKVYTKAEEQFGTSEIPVNTFNKVWILPESATVYEHEQTVYVVNAHLKVMLDSDYQAMQHEIPASKDANLELQSSIIKEIIIPEIEREVNEGKHFAPLRQIYHSLILAKWYKETIKNSLLSQVYVDKNLIDGINIEDETIKDQIYSQYIEAYKKGVFNYIREDYDQLSQEVIPRKYFSGGIDKLANIALKRSSSPVVDTPNPKYRARVAVAPQGESVSSPVEKEEQSPSDLVPSISSSPVLPPDFNSKPSELIGGTTSLSGPDGKHTSYWKIDQTHIYSEREGFVLANSLAFRFVDIGSPEDLGEPDFPGQKIATPRYVLEVYGKSPFSNRVEWFTLDQVSVEENEPILIRRGSKPKIIGADDIDLEPPSKKVPKRIEDRIIITWRENMFKERSLYLPRDLFTAAISREYRKGGIYVIGNRRAGAFIWISNDNFMRRYVFNFNLVTISLYSNFVGLNLIGITNPRLASHRYRIT